MNDTERLNFLVSNDLNLINDDAGRWACVSDGIQNVPDDETAGDINSTFFIEKHQWKKSIREAIDYMYERIEKYKEENKEEHDG